MKVKFMATSAIIAALYIVVTLVFSAIQLRASPVPYCRNFQPFSRL